MTISTRKAKRIRLGISMARDGRRPSVSGSWTAFGQAYDRETKTLLTMNNIMPVELKQEYQSLVLSGVFGFANEETKGRILQIEGATRGAATKFLRESGTR